MSLIYTTRPSALEICIDPSPTTRRRIQTERFPGSRCGGMLQYPAKLSHGVKRGLKATAVIPFYSANFGTGSTMPVTPPSFAWRMSHNAIRSPIEPCISSLIPNFHVRQTRIRAIGKNEQCCDLGFHKLNSCPTQYSGLGTPETLIRATTSRQKGLSPDARLHFQTVFSPQSRMMTKMASRATYADNPPRLAALKRTVQWA
jgi:hypothetical protein